MNWKKRIVSLALAAVIGLSTFLASGVEAEAAGAIAKGIDVSNIRAPLTGARWQRRDTALHLLR